MPTIAALQHRPPRSLALVLTGLIHIVLLLAWRHARAPAPPDGEVRRIAWLQLTPPPLQAPRRPPPPPKPAPAPRAAPAKPTVQAAPAVPDIPPAPAPSAAIAVPPPDPFEQAAPAAVRDADAIRKRALKDLVKIDQDLRKESLNKYARPDDSPEQRLIAGIKAARRGPAWYEAATIEELNIGDQSGDRVYKIRTAALTYCIRYKSGRKEIGGPQKTYESCPR